MARHVRSWSRVLLAIVCALLGAGLPVRAVSSCRADDAKPIFEAGAANVDISPQRLPVIVNGNFFAVNAEKVVDPLHARAIVLRDARTTLALCVVDSCVVPREIGDQIKQLVRDKTGIATDRIMISATHTHSAPSLMRAHASEIDPYYPQQFTLQVAGAIEQAWRKLAPAEAGWTVVDDREHTFCRQWIYRPDRVKADPFGELTVRANMHPGHENPDCIGPEGPIDPGLTLLAIRRPQGQPVAVLANYSMHYYGAPAVSADYFGHFAEALAEQLTPPGQHEAPVAMMSQGTSGDLMWLDYGKPRVDPGVAKYAHAVAQVAIRALQNIRYRSDVSLAMAQRELPLTMRVPDEKRLAWARDVVAKLGDNPPKDLGQIYAREQIFLHDHPQRNVTLQVLRIGELGITAIPCEVFAITGLKLKARSPLVPTLNIELANGEDGYIPPPELHQLGGYTTWACRTAGLETTAEPKIVEALLAMLEEVAGKPRRPLVEKHGAYPQAVLASRPWAYWRLHDWTGSVARDASGHDRAARIEPGVAFYLDGPPGEAFSQDLENRAVHLAGGRLTIDARDLPVDYTVSCWFWNGLPHDARPLTAALLARTGGTSSAGGDQLILGGTLNNRPGRLLVSAGAEPSAAPAGEQTLAPKTWHHIALVRQGNRLSVYLDGAAQPEASVEAPVAFDPQSSTLILGGSGDRQATLEGKLDEVAVFDRPLSAAEITEHYRAAAPAKPMAKD